MGVLKYKGYTGSVEYSEADDCLYGSLQGMFKHFISYEGKTLKELKTSFKEAINDYLDACKKDNIQPQKAYTGQLNIRIPSEVHGKIAMLAKEKGESINSIIKKALIKTI